ncbi:MAG: Crp/Fnr family transcriptional regulator [Flavobacteriaceae bacterium]|jgi:CRP-like cAMP-binding protein|nr:Crp/Fnr family transcriptional regulator [Flavobacteriaceae bacterium]
MKNNEEHQKSEIYEKVLLKNHEFSEFKKYFKRMEVPAKTVLLSEGEISRKIFFIEKGCIRAWINNGGKDVSFQFFFENSAVSSIESFQKNIPSQVYLETVEPSVLWFTYKKDVDQIISEILDNQELREKIVHMIFQRTFDYMKHFLSFIRDTPQQRYLNLTRENPQLIRRIPAHYIASYLGISTVHLSRIKSKLLKENR